MLRLIRSTIFNDPETIDAVDSYESEQEGLLEDELQRSGDFYAPTRENEKVAVFSSSEHNYDRIPTAKELAYYADYDPVIGYRIAVTLGILILLFIIFVLYKTHCHQKKNRQLVKSATHQQS